MIAPTDLHPSPAPHFKTCVYVALLALVTGTSNYTNVNAA